MPAHTRPPRVLAGVLVGGLLASATVLGCGVASAAPRVWTVLASFPPPVAYVASVSCFSATGCVAVGWTPATSVSASTPIELRTTDAGGLWTPVSLPHGPATLVSVVCTGATCVAGGNGPVLLRSIDDGLTWSVVGLPSTIAVVAVITCPTASACFAEGRSSGSGPSGTIIASSDGGATWTSQFNESTSYLRSLWCATATSCFAYGTSFVATSDGSQWGTYAATPAFPTLAVCPSANECVGSSPSAGIVTSRDGGATWAMSDGAVVPTALSCGSPTSCVGTDGANLVLTTDGGTTWSEVSPAFPSQSLLGVACPSAAGCQVVGYATADAYPDRALMLAVAPGNLTFTPERVSNAIDAAGSTSCTAPAVCVVAAVDAYGNPMLLRTPNDGTSWVDLALPSALALEDQAVCPTSSDCLVVGSDVDGQGAVWRTSNAGQSWVASRTPPSLGEVNRVWCASVSRCVATGYLTNSWTVVLSSTDGGRSWTSRQMPRTATGLFGVVCATAVVCVAVGGRGAATGVAFYTSNGGRTWRTSRVLGGLEQLSGVACVSAKVCLAASSVRRGPATHGAVARSTNAGATWEPVAAPGTTAQLDAISCWSAISCEAVGQTTAAMDAHDPTAASAITTTNAGRAWVGQPIPKDEWALASVSCTRAGVCLAAGIGSFAPPSLPTGATILGLP